MQKILTKWGLKPKTTAPRKRHWWKTPQGNFKVFILITIFAFCYLHELERWSVFAVRVDSLQEANVPIVQTVDMLLLFPSSLTHSVSCFCMFMKVTQTFYTVAQQKLSTKNVLWGL